MAHCPKFKINGTNAALQRFIGDCQMLAIPVSKANSFFRDDYEHCLMPAHSVLSPYSADNIKLQTLCSDIENPDIVFDLATDYDKALSFAGLIAELNEPLQSRA